EQEDCTPYLADFLGEATVFLQVAVGMPVTQHPPHRSRRAALPHRAPASGDDAQTQSACRTQSSTCDRENPALRPAPGMLDHVPLGQPPSLHPLRQLWRTRTLVRGLHRYYGAVRLPAPVHHGRTPQVPRADLAITRQARGRASRVPHTVFLRMPEVS